MVERNFDRNLLIATMWRYLPIEGFDSETWLEDEDNIALIDEDGNLSLFEYNLPGVYTGHWFYPFARGKEAIKLAHEMLDEIFSAKYDVQIIRGLTPLQKLGARWLAKKVGFESHGVTHTQTGPCELFILTKEQYMTKGK